MILSPESHFEIRNESDLDFQTHFQWQNSQIYILDLDCKLCTPLVSLARSWVHDGRNFSSKTGLQVLQFTVSGNKIEMLSQVPHLSSGPILLNFRVHFLSCHSSCFSTSSYYLVLIMEPRSPQEQSRNTSTNFSRFLQVRNGQLNSSLVFYLFKYLRNWGFVLRSTRRIPQCHRRFLKVISKRETLCPPFVQGFLFWWSYSNVTGDKASMKILCKN